MMPEFPVDAPKAKVLGTLQRLGFRIIREAEHIAMVRENSDGTRTPLTMPNLRKIKGLTRRAIGRQSGLSRDDVITADEKA